jgi:hypothetical protein
LTLPLIATRPAVIGAALAGVLRGGQRVDGAGALVRDLGLHFRLGGDQLGAGAGHEARGRMVGRRGRDGAAFCPPTSPSRRRAPPAASKPKARSIHQMRVAHIWLPML